MVKATETTIRFDMIQRVRCAVCGRQVRTERLLKNVEANEFFQVRGFRKMHSAESDVRITACRKCSNQLIENGTGWEVVSA